MNDKYSIERNYDIMSNFIFSKKFDNKQAFENYLQTQRYFSASYAHCHHEGESAPDDNSILLFNTGDVVAVWDDRIGSGYVSPAITSRMNESKKTQKTIKSATVSKLQKIIKEGVSKFHKQIIKENGFDQYGNAYGYDDDNISDEDAMIKFDREHSKNPDKYIDPRTVNSDLEAIDENEEVATPQVMDMLNGYLEAALWTEEDELGDSNIESDVSFEAKVDSYRDIKNFMNQAGELIDNIDPSQVGHDLWLTRNGHGTGFWDRDLGEIGDKLSDIALSMGSKSVYVGDDGKIYME